MSKHLKDIEKTIRNMGVEPSFLPFILENLEDTIISDNPDILLYLFPLIERICVEILIILEDTNVEHKEQGVYKTMSSLIENNAEKLVLEIGEKNINLLRSYFTDSEDVSLRNKVCHPSTLDEVAYADLDMIKKLALELIIILEIKSGENLAKMSSVIEKIRMQK